jgi:hypothetical protein
VFLLLEVLKGDQTPRHPDPRFGKGTQRQSLFVFLNRVSVFPSVAERLRLLITQCRLVCRLLLSDFQGSVSAGGDNSRALPISVADGSYPDRIRTGYHSCKFKLATLAGYPVADVIYKNNRFGVSRNYFQRAGAHANRNRRLCARGSSSLLRLRFGLGKRAGEEHDQDGRYDKVSDEAAVKSQNRPAQTLRASNKLFCHIQA